MKRIVIGLDPSTRSTGFAAIDPDTRELLHTALFTSDLKDANRRVKHIAEQVGEALMGIDPDCEVSVYSENTVMRGKGGATFQRCIGAMHAQVPYEWKLGEVQNSTVKKLVGGHGKADKLEVAYGARMWAIDVEESGNKIIELIIDGSWDITDAIAIAIAGHLKASGAP